MATYIVLGCHDIEFTQEICLCQSKGAAEREAVRLNDLPNNHPDLHYWAENYDTYLSAETSAEHEDPA